MDLKEANKIIETLEKSPIRKYLISREGISLFDGEKDALKDIDNIINISKGNLQNPLKIVTLGEVKAGKSTLVNALVGKKVSYTNVLEATATVLEVRYSEEEKIIIKKNNGKDILLGSLKELDSMIEKNSDNMEFFNEVNKILVSTNTERLKEVTIVDTPGLNTVTSENAKRTEDYIANADVILWVLNSHHLGQSDVSEKIEEVLDYGKPIIAVLNRIDEVNGDSSELIEYVEDEMGYMFVDIFATSAKKAWEGYYDGDDKKIKESNISNLYNYIVNNIEKNADGVQEKSVLDAIEAQVSRDLYIHKHINFRLEEMLKNIENDIEETKGFNRRVKDIIHNKIREWTEREFFQEEKEILTNCASDDEFNRLQKKYSSDEYIHNVLNNKYNSLSDYINSEWINNNEKLNKRNLMDEIAMTSYVHTCNVINQGDYESEGIMDGVKKGGVTAGAVGLGLAGYAAWLGPAAAYVSIGTAVTAFLPPLLIAGALGGVALKVVGGNKDKINKYNRINEFILEIKSSVKNNGIENMQKNLFDASDYYMESSIEMISSILKQCNTSKDEVAEIYQDTQKYIDFISSCNVK